MSVGRSVVREQARTRIGFDIAGVLGEAADKNHRPALVIESVRDERTERVSAVPLGQGRQHARPARSELTPGVSPAAHWASFNAIAASLRPSARHKLRSASSKARSEARPDTWVAP